MRSRYDEVGVLETCTTLTQRLPGNLRPWSSMWPECHSQPSHATSSGLQPSKKKSKAAPDGFDYREFD